MTKLILSMGGWTETVGLFFSPNNYSGPTGSPGRYLNVDQGTRLVPWQLFISIVTLTLINKPISHYYANLASGGSHCATGNILIRTSHLSQNQQSTIPSYTLPPDKPSEGTGQDQTTSLSQCINISFFFQVSIQSGWEWLYCLMDALISLGLNLSHVEAEYLSRKSWCLVKVLL